MLRTHKSNVYASRWSEKFARIGNHLAEPHPTAGWPAVANLRMRAHAPQPHRALRSSSLFDRCLYDVEQLLDGDSTRGEIFEVINDLTEEPSVTVLLTAWTSTMDIGRSCRFVNEFTVLFEPVI
jgi:hypothetical protein